jgi:hypothetical protein
LFPPNPACAIPFIQHIVGIITILGLGWIVGNLTRLRFFWVPAVTLLYAVWPKVIWYEHEIVTESVFLSAFILTAALAFPVESLRDRRRLFWFFVAAAAVVALKPHGRGIWLGSILAAWLITRENPLHWGRNAWSAIVVGEFFPRSLAAPKFHPPAG